MHEGIETAFSNHSVDETVARLKQLIEAKGAKIFAVIDHSGEAAAAGLSMPNTKLVIFGAPKAGTPVMLAEPTTALDLPLKILVAESAMGATQLSWNSPAWLQKRHSLADKLVAPLQAAAALAHAAAE
ncbi:MAG TPA: DUF302 domain-containing protein [Acidobacteriaceae bacterium]|nr:DUF302 domain-containing protein [Acidobacteriaceae bacterium]